MPTTQTEENSSTSFLDGCRGLAALYVVFSHARYLLTAGYQDGMLKRPAEYGLINKACFYALSFFRFGPEAVIFFFVLSGFVIHLRQAKGLAASPVFNVDWKQYLWRCARRLYPPLLLAIAATYLIDSAGMALNWPIYSGQTESPIINSLHPLSYDGTTLLGNLLFLMRAYVPVWGSDGPLWSLHYEWWFYMIYPLFFLLSRKSWTAATVTMVLLFALSHAPMPAWANLFATIFSLMIVWWMGAILADVYAGRIRLPMKWMVALICLLPVALAIELVGNRYLPPVLGGDLVSLSLGAGFCGVIAAGFVLQSRGIRLTALNRLKWLGEMSYTLYVIHFPLLLFIGGWLMSRNGENVLPRHSGWVLPGVAVAMLVAFAAHFLVERPFLPKQRRATAANPS